jgi:small GTP-binding protein
MSDQFAFDVFLSYSSKDKDVVRPLAERLRKDGLRVWFDNWEIKPGGSADSRNKQIEDGLERSRVLVFCMSASAFGSDWSTLESQTLRFRDPLNKERRFIPVRLDDVSIKGSLAQFLYIDWLSSREEDYEKLRKACQLPARQPVPEEEPTPKQVSENSLQLDHGRADVVAYAFSRDGKRALTGAYDKALRLWDVEKAQCIRVMECEGSVHRVVWIPDQDRALSASGDDKVRLWDINAGRLQRQFEGHTNSADSVALSPDRRRALSGSNDKTVRLWDLDTGRCQRVLKGHTGPVFGLAWGADERRALSGSEDGTLRLWDVKTGRCLQVLEGHTGGITSVEWSANQRYALSGSWDNTVRLWDMEAGLSVRVFEGHSNYVMCLAWSVDDRLALSGALDNTVRLWDVPAGRCLGVLEGHEFPVRGVGWVADRAFSGDSNGGVRIWDLSEFFSEARTRQIAVPSLLPSPDQVRYTNAKVLLVGDTGVGKSALAWRLLRGRFLPTKSSHSRQAHVLESKVVKDPNVSMEQETILWDLAGQPAYRSVHQLSMDDAALACVLFDARSETNPFEGPSYWSQVLDQARTNTRVRKILVASRIDVGGLPAGKARIEAFVQENGFAGFIPTSASTGEGCTELLNAIRSSIPWAELPKVTTTKILAAMRDYVARLKEEKDDGKIKDPGNPRARLFTTKAIHEGFASFYGEKITFDELIGHLQRLEAVDAVSLLVFRSTEAAPRPEDKILLDPTRIDAYSSAILVAAKDEPDGPGHLLESRVRDGDFKLDQEERIADRDSERHVLSYVMEKLLARDLALRERIKGQDYVVFPSQCTAELRFPGTSVFGVTFGFAGPVRSIYARLIAHLAHYEGLKKREFFQDAAAYRAETGGRCVIRLRDQGRGQGELEVLYDNETLADVRQGFLEFVGKQLEANSTPGSVTRRLAYHCANSKCGNAFEDRVVKARLEARKRNLVCPICEEKTPLVDLLASPSAAAERIAAQIITDAESGRQRMTAAFVIKAKEAEGKFDVFLSHNSKDKAAVEKIARQLLKVGLRPWLDKWNLAGGDTATDALEQAIRSIPCAALCFGPADIGKWHIIEIRSYIAEWAKKKARMIPVILPGADKTPELPLFVEQTVWVDMRDWEQGESDAFYQLACAITGRPPGDSPMKRFGVRHVVEWQKEKS